MPLPAIAVGLGTAIVGGLGVAAGWIFKGATAVVVFNAIPAWAWVAVATWFLGGRKVIEKSGSVVVEKVTTLGIDVIRVVVDNSSKYIIPQVARASGDICGIFADSIEGVREAIKSGITKVDDKIFNERMNSLNRLVLYKEKEKEIEDYYNNLRNKYRISSNDKVGISLQNKNQCYQIIEKH